MSFATNLEEYHHERKRPEHCQLHHLLRMLQKKFRSMPPSPRKARNTSNISAGWIAMNASRHAPRPRQNLTLRLSLAVRSRQIEAYPNLMSDAMSKLRQDRIEF